MTIIGTPVKPTCTLRFSERIESALWHQWAQAHVDTDLVLLIAELQIPDD